MSIEKKQYFDGLSEKAIAYGLKKGATDVELSLDASSGFSVSSRKGVVEQVEHDKGKSFDVTLMIGNRTGSASTSDLNWSAVKSAIDAAYDIAKYIAEDPFATMPAKDELAFNYPEVKTCFPSSVSIDQAVDMAIACEESAMASDKRIVNSEGVHISSHTSFSYLANSLGFRGSYESSMHDISCILIAKEGGDMQRDYAFSCNRNWDKLNHISDIGKLAADRSIARLGARSLSTQSLPVIFSAGCSKMLINCLLKAISGSAIYKKSSFLLNDLEKKIFPEFINIVERPFIEGALGSAPFDGEGVRTRNKSIIDKGVLSTYLLSTYSANQLKLATTGNSGGVFNVMVDSNVEDQQTLMTMVDKGLLVTEYMGSGINIVNGELSLGVVGHYFENGSIVHPVSEVTIAGNLKNMFQHILGIAADYDGNSSIQIGSVLIESLMVAGNSGC